MSIAQKKEALRAREASRDAAAAEFERADAINFWQESMKQRLQNRIDEVVEGGVEWRFALEGAFGRDKIKLRYLIFDRLKQRLEVHRCTATGKRISPDELHVLESAHEVVSGTGQVEKVGRKLQVSCEMDITSAGLLGIHRG